jgi:hypothetical protein
MAQGQTEAGKPANEEPKKSNGGGWETLAPILGAIATGLGALAFVVMFGGAVLWDRADQAGLPGTGR